MWNRIGRSPHAERVRDAVNSLWPLKGEESLVQHFRHEFSHRVPAFVGRGVVEFGAITRGEGQRWRYSMRPRAPLLLDEVAAALRICHQASLQAYGAVHAFIEQQAAEIIRSAAK